MFGRNNERPANEDQRAVRPITSPAGTREASSVPGGAGGPASIARSGEESVLAADDRIEGKLRTARGVRILGSVDGSIESASHVLIEQSAKVSADVTAEEVIIAGQYTGKLVCRQRLEVMPTGRVSGTIETVKLMLHEGGYVDGELHMQKATQAMAEAPRSAEPAFRPVGAIRSTVEPSIRQPAGGVTNAPSPAPEGGINAE